MRLLSLLPCAISAFTLGSRPFPANAQSLNDNRLQAIKAMEFIAFSTTRQEFLTNYPMARPRQTSPDTTKLGIFSYDIDDPLERIDTIAVGFVGDQLCNTTFEYEKPGIAKSGGKSALLERAIQRFGPPSDVVAADDPQSGELVVLIVTWKFPKIDRDIMVMWQKNTWSIGLQRTSIANTIDITRLQPDVGF